MRSVIRLMTVLALFATSVALAQDVRYNFDKNSDFAKFKTYKWVPLKDAQPMNDLLKSQIEDSIDAELAKKGLTKTDQENADLYIGFQVGVGQEKQFSSYSTDWGYGSGWGRGGWYDGAGGSSMTTGQTSTIYTGQLALDMYDNSNHTLVWRGVASKTIDTKAKPEKQQKNLQKTVAKLLKNYPPPLPKSDKSD